VDTWVWVVNMVVVVFSVVVTLSTLVRVVVAIW
jgi:hypothetical protein